MDAKELDQNEFKRRIVTDGFCLVENVLDRDTVLELRRQTQKAVDTEAAWHGGTAHRDYGVVQACPMYGGAFLNLLENKTLMEPFNLIMGEGSILYVYISSSMPPHMPNFSSRIHVDRPRLFPGYCECLASLVLLSDFTKENGCTMYLPGSHNTAEQPTEETFNKNAVYLLAPAGSVFYFNLRLWHSGGLNKTDTWRHALALGVVRPYLKQKFDLPKMIEHYKVDTSMLSDYGKQKLGYFAIPPSSLEEFYGPVEKRTYKEKSEWAVADMGY